MITVVLKRHSGKWNSAHVEGPSGASTAILYSSEETITGETVDFLIGAYEAWNTNPLTLDYVIHSGLRR